MGTIVTKGEIPSSLIKNFIGNFIIMNMVVTNIMDKVEVASIIINTVDYSSLS